MFFTLEEFLNKVDAVIIANGRFPKHPIPLSYIEKAEYLVCCDGAANLFIEQGGIPDAIVGDGDSISETNRERFADILFIDSDEETNDLTKSVKYCIKQGKRNVVIVAGTGKRDDHTLGNISLLAEYVREINVRMITNYGVFTPIQSTTEFRSFKNQNVSVFCIDREPITLAGLKYPLNNAVLTNWWQGTLNKSLGDSFTVETTGRVIVFQGHRQELSE